MQLDQLTYLRISLSYDRVILLLLLVRTTLPPLLMANRFVSILGSVEVDWWSYFLI